MDQSQSMNQQAGQAKGQQAQNKGNQTMGKSNINAAQSLNEVLEEEAVRQMKAKAQGVEDAVKINVGTNK